jgi:hypothetical protein
MSAAGKSGLCIVIAALDDMLVQAIPEALTSRARSPPLTGAAGEHGNVLHSAQNEGAGCDPSGHF